MVARICLAGWGLMQISEGECKAIHCAEEAELGGRGGHCGWDPFLSVCPTSSQPLPSAPAPNNSVKPHTSGF